MITSDGYIPFSQQLPPENFAVMTIIIDENDNTNRRNKQMLTRRGKLLFTADGCYVYYTPTHWKFT